MDLSLPTVRSTRLAVVTCYLVAGCASGSEQESDVSTTVVTTGSTMPETSDDTQDMTTGTTSDPTTAGPSCGDGVVQDGEECDIGDNNGPGSMCKEDCTLNFCGDGDKGPFEGCDDGNQNDTDECTNECKVITCGNGMPDPGEECDDGNDDDNDECLSTCVLPPSPCGMQTYEADIKVKPVDIIFVIDNSESMGEEIKGVQDNINQNFAAIFEQSGLDYRVVMVSRHGSWSDSQSVCIEAPLSGIPAGGCDTPPAQPAHNPGKFYHYSVSVASRNPWCKLLEHFPDTAEDQFGEMGYMQWLREDSIKTIVAISDDGIECSYNSTTYNDLDTIQGGQNTAEQFDTDLLALSPEMFGNSNVRKYNYYSIVGLDYNDPPDEPYTALDPLTNAACPTAANPGTGHQALSVLTQSLRYPLCDTSSYDVVFQSIAQGVLAGTVVSCDFVLPTPPNNFEIDLNSIEIFYTPMGMGEPIKITQILNKGNCGPNNFYIEAGFMHLCPTSCELVQSDFQAKIDIQYACKQDIG